MSDDDKTLSAEEAKKLLVDSQKKIDKLNTDLKNLSASPQPQLKPPPHRVGKGTVDHTHLEKQRITKDIAEIKSSTEQQVNKSLQNLQGQEREDVAHELDKFKYPRKDSKEQKDISESQDIMRDQLKDFRSKKENTQQRPSITSGYDSLQAEYNETKETITEKKQEETSSLSSRFSDSLNYTESEKNSTAKEFEQNKTDITSKDEGPGADDD